MVPFVVINVMSAELIWNLTWSLICVSGFLPGGKFLERRRRSMSSPMKSPAEAKWQQLRVPCSADNNSLKELDKIRSRSIKELGFPELSNSFPFPFPPTNHWNGFQSVPSNASPLPLPHPDSSGWASHPDPINLQGATGQRWKDTKGCWPGHHQGDLSYYHQLSIATE